MQQGEKSVAVQDSKRRKVPRGVPEEGEITLAPVEEVEGDERKNEEAAAAARAKERQAGTNRQGSTLPNGGHLEQGSRPESEKKDAPNRRDASSASELIARSRGCPVTTSWPRMVKEGIIHGLNLIKKWILLPPLYLSGLGLDYCYEKLLLEGFLTSSLVGPGPFFDSEQFPMLRAFEDNWEEIRDEVMRVRERNRLPLLHEVDESQHWENGGRWETLILKIYNVEIEENIRIFPAIRRVLHGIGGNVPTAMISVLKAGGHIKPHYGYYNGVLRYHLALKVPPNPEPPSRLGIRVSNRWSTWNEGKAIMFDDCYEHEVWNESEDERVVLFLDVVRPLPRFYSMLNAAFIFLMRWHPTVLGYRTKAPLSLYQTQGSEGSDFTNGMLM